MATPLFAVFLDITVGVPQLIVKATAINFWIAQ
jgi:hypothetical protein